MNPQTDDEQIKTKKFAKLGNSNDMDAEKNFTDIEGDVVKTNKLDIKGHVLPETIGNPVGDE